MVYLRLLDYFDRLSEIVRRLFFFWVVYVYVLYFSISSNLY